MADTFLPYEGTEPYIFPSYSAEDTRAVMPILSAMSRRGYRVWYNKGIQAGMKWMDLMARRLHDCAACLAFLSQSSAQSAYCEAELNAALDAGKPIVSIYLEDHVALEPGLRMYLRTRPSFQTWQMEENYPLLDWIEETEAFQNCKESRTE